MDFKGAFVYFKNDAKLLNFTLSTIQRRISHLWSQREKIWKSGNYDIILQKVSKASDNAGQ